ncbi:hypothetical protein CYMTET_33701 [Cymbomonas tetramitiformis]|uniref:Uncharacterized protein n=1 Tax=Cymbomonas tetramitiformis TaxID=36881 RepID=A0AAE0FCM7_9CHLO|nr:hypothetical protein CYMTET_33701 [Cymbomonas tetramitiformis]
MKKLITHYEELLKKHKNLQSRFTCYADEHQVERSRLEREVAELRKQAEETCEENKKLEKHLENHRGQKRPRENHVSDQSGRRRW